MEILENVIAFILFGILGIFTGAMSGTFGIGGGIILVPILIYFFTPHEAIGISILQMMFSSSLGSFLNIKQKTLNFKDGIFIGIGGAAGGFLSGFILKIMSAKILTTAFLLLGFYNLFNILKPKKKINPNASHNEIKKNIIMIFAGVLTGAFAISLGIGGGIILVPILVAYLGYSTKEATPIALFFVVFSSIFGVISFINNDILSTKIFYFGIILGIFSMVGVTFGTKFLKIINSSLHKKILILIYIFSITATLIKVISYWS